MSPLKFKFFTFPRNPESWEIHAERQPVFQIGADHSIRYTGLGPMCRVLRGSGVFTGPRAYESFHTLEVAMAEGTAGSLIHPVFGTMQAFLTRLELRQECRENYAAYSFEFREADESGMIPPLSIERNPG